MTRSLGYHKAISGMTSSSVTELRATKQYHTIFRTKTIQLAQSCREKGLKKYARCTMGINEAANITVSLFGFLVKIETFSAAQTQQDNCKKYMV